MKTATIREQVTQFHIAGGIPIKPHPEAPNEDRVRLRLRLIEEEFFELLASCLKGTATSERILGWTPSRMRDVRRLVQLIVEDMPIDVDMVEVADALADLDYVVEGTRLELGIFGPSVAAEVHASNMRKFPPCIQCTDESPYQCPSCKGLGVLPIQREDGKIVKPEGWTPPDIESVLRAQGWSP